MRVLKAAIATVVSLGFWLGLSAPVYASSPALVPTFGTPESVAGGFAVQITNWDSTFTWSATASDCAIASVEDGWLSVQGAFTGQSITSRVTTSKTGHEDGSATFSGTAGQFVSGNYVSDVGENSSPARQAIVNDSSGTIYAAWYSGLKDLVTIKKSSDDGQSWAFLQTFQASRVADDFSASAPSLAIGPAGNLAVAYRTANGSDYEVMVSTSQDAGVSWTSPVLVSGVGKHNRLRVGFGSNGDIAAAWDTQVGFDFEVYTSISEDGGATWSGPLAMGLTSEDSLSAQMVTNSSGELVLIFEGESKGPRATVFNPAASLFGTVVGINSTNFAGSSISVSAAQTGGLVWASWVAGFFGSRTVQVASFDGVAWSLKTSPTPTVSGILETKVLANSGRVIVIWHNGNSVFSRTSNSEAAVSWVNPKTLTGGVTDSVQNMDINGNTAGQIAVAWMRQESATSKLVPQVVLSVDQGSTFTTASAVAATNVSNFNPVLHSAGTGALIYFWREQKSNVRIRAAAIAATVDLTDPRELYQVAEINPGAAHSGISGMTVMGNKLYLIANNVNTGRELYVYDGAGVELVADLNPGTGSGLYGTDFVANTGSAIYFQGTDGFTGFELYKYDGTAISLVAELEPAQTTPNNAEGQLFAGSMPGLDGRSAVLGSKLYFEADHPSALTSYVLDLGDPNAVPQTLAAAHAGYTVGGLISPIVLGGHLYFIGIEAGLSGVYRTDGTAAPTLVPGTAGKHPFTLGDYDGKLVFGGAASANQLDIELMIWNPATPTTPAAVAADINTTASNGSTAGSYPTQFVNRCGELYFAAATGFESGFENRELWKFNGSTTSLVKDFYPGALASDSGNPQSITAIGDEIFTFAQTADAGFEPWLLSGSQISMIQDFRPGAASSISGAPPVVEWNGQVYTVLWDATNGLELFAFGVKPLGHEVVTYNHEFEITFDANGGTGTTTAMIAAGDLVLPSGTGFAKGDKVFLGWDASSTAAAPTYEAGDNFTVSGSATVYAIWGEPEDLATQDPDADGNGSGGDTGGTGSNASAPVPSIQLPAGSTLSAPAGGDLELTGSGLGSVTKAEVDTEQATIKDKGDTFLKLGLPDMPTGVYDLTLTSGQGKLTLPRAVRIIAGSPGLTPGAQAALSAWTKGNLARTEVRIYAKNPIGAGKVQFMHNGREIAWVRAIDGNDPRLLSRNSTSYLMRTVRLLPGKNVFEIYLNGERIRRVAYTR